MRFPARLALVVTLAAAGGCSQKVTFDDIASHPAPEMASTTDRWVDTDRDYAYMRNTNYRGLLDDLRRAFLIDHPSRLSPYPIADTAGDPR